MVTICISPYDQKSTTCIYRCEKSLSKEFVFLTNFVNVNVRYQRRVSLRATLNLPLKSLIATRLILGGKIRDSPLRRKISTPLINIWGDEAEEQMKKTKQGLIAKQFVGKKIDYLVAKFVANLKAKVMEKKDQILVEDPSSS